MDKIPTDFTSIKDTYYTALNDREDFIYRVYRHLDDDRNNLIKTNLLIIGKKSEIL